MKFCKHCGYKLGEQDTFCGHCGRAQIENNAGHRRENSHAQQSKRPAFVPALQTEEGKQRYDFINYFKFGQYQSSKKTCNRIAIFFIIVTGVLLNRFGVYYWPAYMPLFFALIAWFSMSATGWSEADYYSIPGSRDSSGKHRCIHCGSTGVYRQGQYKSDVTYASCPTCKKHFWAC